MIPSQYFLYARLSPAIICSVPFAVLYFFVIEALLGPFFESLVKLSWVGDITTVSVFIALLAMVGRAISKDLFESYWFKGDGTSMPTTDFLMHSSTEYSPGFKEKIHARIRDDFKIEILSVQNELENEQMARRVIAEAVGLVRQKVKDGRLLLQHNIEYGFFRNLIGCSVVALMISVVNVVVFYWLSPNSLALNLSTVLCFIYALPILLSKLIMAAHGKRYARVLFQEYLAN